MTENFNIICNHCGQNVSVPPFQKYVTCYVCQTHLKIEETETTITATIVADKEFPTVNQSPIPINTSNRNKQNELKEYQKRLQTVEQEWLKKEETFKFKRGGSLILPRKNQSITFLVLGIIIALISIVIPTISNTVFYIIGPILIFTNGKEYRKSLKYEQAKQDYLDEKKMLETTIKLKQS